MMMVLIHSWLICRLLLTTDGWYVGELWFDPYLLYAVGYEYIVYSFTPSDLINNVVDVA